MNEILFKNADKKIIHIVNKLQKQIKGSPFEGKTYLSGQTVRKLLFKEPITDMYFLVETKNGGVMLANYLALKNQCWVKDKNPMTYDTCSIAMLNIFNDNLCKNIPLYFRETEKETKTFGSLEENAKKICLTINSIFYNITTEEIIDHNHAIDDMFVKTIRTPINAYSVFTNNPINMLKTIRMSAHLGWGIEKNTWLGLLECAHKVRLADKKEISDELSKILVSPNASIGIEKLYYGGLLHRIIPDLYETTKAYEDKLKNYTTFQHTLKVLNETQPILEHRLAALFHDIGNVLTAHDKTTQPDKFSAEIAATDLKTLKFSDEIINSVKTAIMNHRFFKSYANDTVPTDKKIRKFISSCGNNIAITLDLMNANNLHQREPKKTQVFNILTRMEELEKSQKEKAIKLPINGNHLMKHFNLRKGPIIGTMMQEVREEFAKNNKLTEQECYEIAQKVLVKCY